MTNRVPTPQERFGVRFLDEILFWIRLHLAPDEVYPYEELALWAETNGFVKQDNF